MRDNVEEIELFIFDMDGLLFETGRLSYQAYLESGKIHDYEVTHALYYYLTGRTEADIRKSMQVLFGAELPTEAWRTTMNDEKEKIYAREQSVHKKKGVEEILDFAKTRGLKIAVASSNYRKKIKKYIRLEGIEAYFDIIVSGDEGCRGKPHPDIFLKACEKADISPEQTIVFEDSKAGVEAAKRAGIRSVLIEDDITDLPIYLGKHRIKKDLSHIKEVSAFADFQFENLLEARDFFQKNM